MNFIHILGQLGKILVIALTSLALILGCGLCLVFGVPYLVDEVSREIALIDARSRIPTAQERLDELIIELQSMTGTELLVNDMTEVSPIRMFRGCIRASGFLEFGTDHSYRTIISAYSEALLPQGWSQPDPIPTGLERDESLVIFRNETGSINLAVRHVSAREDNLSRYQTLYSVYLMFAEPTIQGCYP